MTPRLEVLIREYDLITQHFIYQNSHRLRELTTFLVLQAGIAAFVTGQPLGTSHGMVIGMSLVGLLVACLFYFLIAGSSHYLKVRIQQARYIEKAIHTELKDELYNGFPDDHGGEDRDSDPHAMIFEGFGRFKRRAIETVINCTTACITVVLLTALIWALVLVNRLFAA